ncbi:DUF1361 domain-containing protein [Listeria aquatica]|uniref:DUF1361 domain-containing protein n=1 Tax=Listeria aquatica TaxID=1494960 RepID=A0A841ZMW1_9LIST|nr:DUF1361 domain-containing protein [Listeria aquatica]MBC1522009.1 DUF1361 domain-containing protein [Listeria aquatica]
MKKLIWACRIFYLSLMLLLFFVLDYYHFLILNVTLAYIPFEIAVFLYHKKRNPFVFWIVAVAWLLFFPNAFYLVTDFFHLKQFRIYDYNGILKKDSFLWQSFSVMAASIFFGLFVGNLSLQFFLDASKERMKKDRTFLLLPLVLLLSSYGIYLGRFERLHTIHLITEPLEAVKSILDISSFQFEFIGYLFILQLLVYLMFRFFPKRP